MPRPQATRPHMLHDSTQPASFPKASDAWAQHPIGASSESGWLMKGVPNKTPPSHMQCGIRITAAHLVRTCSPPSCLCNTGRWTSHARGGSSNCSTAIRHPLRQAARRAPPSTQLPYAETPEAQILENRRAPPRVDNLQCPLPAPCQPHHCYRNLCCRFI